MKLYIAAPFICQSEARNKAVQLRSMGIVVTSRWLTEDPNAKLTAEYQAERAQIDLEDINSADYFLLLSDQDSRTGGNHFETGYAFSAGKTILIVGRHENVFHWLPRIVFIETWGEAVNHIWRIEEALLDKVQEN